MRPQTCSVRVTVNGQRHETEVESHGASGLCGALRPGL